MPFRLKSFAFRHFTPMFSLLSFSFMLRPPLFRCRLRFRLRFRFFAFSFDAVAFRQADFRFADMPRLKPRYFTLRY